MTPREFTAFFPFGGIGVGARGFIKALARLGPDSARFRNLGGIDLDPAACEDFRTLTGVPSLCANIHTLTPAELISWLTEIHGAELANRAPDCVFTSPPCKGYSRLLGNDKAKERKYQDLNNLVFDGLFLMCEAWPKPPPIIVLENVPGIMSRGKEVLEKSRKLLANYGYVFHEATHDCGEIGGLAQHRKRFLLIARRPDDVPAYIYQPPRKRVRACGEVLQELPIPGSGEGGELHELPKLSWLNWVRLALIPAGGDWRDLPGAGAAATNQRANRRPNQYQVREWRRPTGAVTGDTDIQEGAPSIADPRIGMKAPARADNWKDRPGLMRVNGWDEPTPAITGSAQVSGSNGTAAVADPRPFGNVNRVTSWDAPVGTITASPAPSSGAAAVADPRLALTADNPNRHHAKYRIEEWDQPAHTVTGTDQRVGSGAPSVADPRVPELLSPVAEGQSRREVFAKYDVRPWDQPARTVAGGGTNGGFGVADPRPFDGGRMGVVPWDQPAKTVCGESYPSNGSASVADPRVGLDHEPRRGSYEVTPWTAPAKTVRGQHDARKSAAAVADPRVIAGVPVEEIPYRCRPRGNTKGPLGVISWQEAAATITGNARHDNGAFAVADPRRPPPKLVVIIAADGTWHRPLTTLELAVLQGLPARIHGKWLELAGRKIAAWRERIGNAVPEGAGEAIATTILKALLAASLGTWFLSPFGEPIWVRQDGVREDELPEWDEPGVAA